MCREGTSGVSSRWKEESSVCVERGPVKGLAEGECGERGPVNREMSSGGPGNWREAYG